MRNIQVGQLHRNPAAKPWVIVFKNMQSLVHRCRQNAPSNVASRL
jgi:hypothetical protein